MIIKESEKKIKIYLKKYFIDYFKKYFTSIDVEISGDFLASTESRIEELIQKNVNLHFSKIVKFNFDRATLNAIDLHNLCGYETVSKIINGTFSFIFKKIAEEEPEKIILDLLKTESNFYFLIKCCYIDFIKRVVNKNFRSLNNFHIEKKDLVVEDIVQYICDNYNYYKSFDSRIASFKTYLYKDTLNSSVLVLRKENILKTYYVINSASVKEIAKKIHPGNHFDLVTERELRFRSRSEAKKWLGNYIDIENITDDVINNWKLIIKKEGFHNFFDSLENHIDDSNLISKNDDKQTWFLHNEAKLMLNKFNLIEKDDVYRLILKLYIGININHSNSEIRKVFGESFNLNILSKLYPLCLSEKIEKSFFFSSINNVLSNYVSAFKSIAASSIQRRIYRLYKKISKEYSFEDLSDIILLSHKEFEYELFTENPIFLRVTDPNCLNEIVERNYHHDLQVIDLSNAKIHEIPPILYEMKNLREINLSYNYISNIPEQFFSLANLKVVDLRFQLNFNGNKDSGINFKEIKQIVESLTNCEFIFE